MNSVTVRFVAVLGILVLEAALILLNIPELSLAAGIVLFGALLFVLGRLGVSRESVPRKHREKPDVNDPAEPSATGRTGLMKTGKQESGLSITTPLSGGRFMAMRRRIRQVFPFRSPPGSVKKPFMSEGEPGATAPVKQAFAGSPVSRFESFRTLRQGLGLLFASRRRSARAGTGTAKTSAKKPDLNDRSTQISMDSVNSEVVSPVRQKQEPSPFSPLAKDIALDENLIFSRIEQGDEPGTGILDTDLNSMEIFADENEIARMDISPDDEPAIAIDLEDEDEVTQIHEAHHDGISAPVANSGEYSLEKGLDELEGFDLDDVDLEEEPGTASFPSGTPSSPGVVLQADSPKQAGTPAMKGSSSSSVDESMLSFISTPSDDDDLLSSLRNDLTAKRNRIDLSLVRDLKDVRVHIGEIEKDITDLLACISRADLTR